MKKTYKVKTAAWQNTPCPENLTHLYLEVLSNINEQPTITGTTHFYKYPLRAGAYSLTFEKAPENSFWQRGLYDALGDISTEPTQPDEPLTGEQIEYISKTVGKSLFDIEDFIKQYRPDIDAGSLTWCEIYKLIARAHKKGSPVEPDDLMRLREIQDKITCLTIQTLKRMIYTGELTGYKKSKFWYVSKKEALIKLPRK